MGQNISAQIRFTASTVQSEPSRTGQLNTFMLWLPPGTNLSKLTRPLYTSVDCRSLTVNAEEGLVSLDKLVVPVIVCPLNPQVIPLSPEFIVSQDGHDKQDCENGAAKRWIDQYGKQYAAKGTTVLGDDLYCHQPMCKLLLQQKLNFLLVCRPESHKTLYEWLAGMPLDTLSLKRWRGKVCDIYTYRYVNQIPLRDGEDALLVNWCELTITRSDGTFVYKNAFATNHLVTAQNVEAIVAAGRTRWKVENENNNTLKTKGYNLDHNFGHGQKHLSSLLATFNILAFLFHTLLDLTDEKYQLIRQHLPAPPHLFRRLAGFNSLSLL